MYFAMPAPQNGALQYFYRIFAMSLFHKTVSLAISQISVLFVTTPDAQQDSTNRGGFARRHCIYHGLINYIDTKAKRRHLKKFTC